MRPEGQSDGSETQQNAGRNKANANGYFDGYIREGEFLFFNAQSLLYYRDPLFELADLANVDDLLLPLRCWNCRETNH